MADNETTNTLRLYWLDLATGAEREIFHHPEQETLRVYRRNGKPVAVFTADAHFHWHVIDDELSSDIDV